MKKRPPRKIRPLAFRDAIWVQETESKAFGAKIAWKLTDYCQVMNEGCQAYVWGPKEPRAAIFLDTTDRRGVRVISLFTDPDWLRHGYARDLLKRAMVLALFHRKKKANLEVSATNSGGIRLYESMGFVTKKTMKNYYGKGKHAFYMEVNAREQFFGRKDVNLNRQG
jgi:ribosomal protein S18 acetylase RimI-like enzyme